MHSQLANECLMVSYGFLPRILQVWVAEGWQVCAKVSKLEEQLADMIRTSSSQDKTLLQMEQELAQKKRELKQVLGHYKASNVDHRKAAHKREFLDENIQLSRKVEQLQAEL